MDHMYYADRPTVPNTQHNAVRLPAILEHSLLVNLEDIHQPFYANAVEIKDEEGHIQGTLLYVGGVSFATLMSEQETEDDVTDGIVLADEDVEDDINIDVASGDGEWSKEDELNSLELLLAEARQKVVEIEDEIAARRTDDLS